jgi:branched-chain amino acid transport system substrate-binding protein
VPEKTNTASGTGASSAKPGSSSAPNGSGSKTNAAMPTPGVPGSPSTPGGPAGSGGPKSPIVFGSIGTDSGILGEILVSALHGAKAWAADINARGGLNGHPVRIVFGDDGGDPGRALSLAKGMVEQQGVIAFYMEHGPGTFQAVEPYAKQNNIPVIGSSNSNVTSARSPITFVVGPAAEFGLVWTQVLPLLVYAPDKHKVSLMYCRESPSCKAGRDIIVAQAGKLGLQVVHEAQVSLTQPDFTAEMLAAKSAGAEAIIPFVDNNTVIRMSRSSKRQGYTPVYSAQYASHDERFLKNGGADIEGVLVGASMPHWSSPKLNDYVAAMQRYVPGGIKASYGELSWATGKLIEVISKDLPDKPTGADLIRGLYALHGETLGGLVPPLTYRPGEGSDQNNHCTVPLRVENGKFASKNGDEFTCEPGWKPTQK